MKTSGDRIPNKETRNIGVYLEDLQAFDKAAENTERSRMRMFRWVVSEWKAGRAVFAPIERPRVQLKRQGKAFTR